MRESGIRALRGLIRETLLTEAAMTPVRASELGIRFQVRKYAYHAAIYAHKEGRDGPAAILEASLSGDPCAGAWAITHSQSRIDGLGPLMYDLMIDVISPNPLAPDRGVVSKDAKRVWDYYLTRRGDIEAIQLDDIDNVLTPEDEDNCAQVSATDPQHGDVDWISSSLSKAYRRKGGGRPTFEELSRLGLIDTW